MANFEARVASILEMMVGDTVSEVSKVVGGTMSTFPEDSARVSERTHEPMDQKVSAPGIGGFVVFRCPIVL